MIDLTITTINTAEEIPQHSQIVVTNHGSGHCLQRLASVVLVHEVFVLVQGVFVLVHGVFVLVHRVFVLVHGVFVLVHGVFVLVHRVFVLVQRVLGLRSSFLGLRFSNTHYYFQENSLQKQTNIKLLRITLYLSIISSKM